MSSSVLDRTPLLVSRRQARQLAAWTKDTGFERPALCRISKQGKYAFYTNRFAVIRWDVSGLDLPDGSWIDLKPGDSEETNTKPDTMSNMADWSRAVGPRSSWDLMDAERWREPDDNHFPDMASLFKREGTAGAPVSFNFSLLSGVSLVVMPVFGSRIMLTPSVGGDESNRHGWWVMSDDDRVSGLIMPRVFEDEDFNLPKPYEANEEEENQ